MTWLETLLTNADPDALKRAVQTFWIVPAGMIALFFYGRSHFNTPDYALGKEDGAASPISLLTLAPPIFTTYRSRFNRFALWYILILETAFLAFVFLTSVFTDIAAILKFKLPEITSDTVQFRALIALFFLTGLLSSFPGFKDLDAWILKKLHQGALIPDDARLLAEQLFAAPFVPHPAVAEAVKISLVSRDTLRVAEGTASGSLENNVLKTLWLINQLQHKITNNKYARFKLKLEKDLKDIVSRREALRPLFTGYFKEQAIVVPDSASDIDQYLIDHSADPQVAQLIERRKEVADRCDDLLYRLCLIVALLVYATKFTPESAGDALRDLGFNVAVHSRGIVDWDAVCRVTASAFVIMLALNAMFALFVYLAGSTTAPAFTPSRESTLRFAVIATLFYFLVMLVVIKFKKYWQRDPDHARPENILVSVYCYLLSLPFFVLFSLWVRGGELSTAPLLFALNQGVAAYFIGIYVDRSLRDQPPDWRWAAWQGLAQATTTFVVTFLAPPVPGFNPSTRDQIAFAVFFAFQSAVAGFLIGFLFQYFYRRTRQVAGKRVGDITLQLGPA